MSIWWFVGIALGLLLVVIWAVAWVLASIVLKPRIHQPEDTWNELLAAGTLTEKKVREDYRPQPFTVKSTLGYTLRGMTVRRRPEDAFADGHERVVILVHGYTVNAVWSLRYVDTFRELGFNVVLYDHRNHGRSDKAFTTMGWYERTDLLTVAEYARSLFGQDCVLGIHGESMGAATVMLSAAQIPNLAFAIEDCGYTSLKQQLSHNLKNEYKVPAFPFLPMASLIAKLRVGVWFGQVVPGDGLRDCHVPMLFIHGEADDFVPYAMVHEAYSEKPDAKLLWTVPGAAHAESVAKDPAGYAETVSRFLTENRIL